MKEALEAALERTDIWLMIFTAIVALGVGGEAVFGVRHWLLSRRLRTVLSAEDQQHRAEIARLNDKAGEANEQAGIAQRDAEIARKNAEGFRLQIAQANERSAQAEQHAAQANEAAERERLARTKIEERLAWRRVNPQQHSLFVGMLSPYKGSTVELEKFGDLEASIFADDIIRVLSDSKWLVRLSMIGQDSTLYIGPGLNPKYGLRCEVNDSLPAGMALVAVCKELRALSITPMPPRDGVVARIKVGIRPPP